MSVVVDVDSDFKSHVFHLLASEAVLKWHQLGRFCTFVERSSVRSHAVTELVGAADGLPCRRRGTRVATLVPKPVEQFVRVVHYINHVSGVCLCVCMRRGERKASQRRGRKDGGR